MRGMVCVDRLERGPHDEACVQCGAEDCCGHCTRVWVDDEAAGHAGHAR